MQYQVKIARFSLVIFIIHETYALIGNVVNSSTTAFVHRRHVEVCKARHAILRLWCATCVLWLTQVEGAMSHMDQQPGGSRAANKQTVCTTASFIRYPMHSDTDALRKYAARPRCGVRIALGIGIIRRANSTCDDYTTALRSACSSNSRLLWTVLVGLQRIR